MYEQPGKYLVSSTNYDDSYETPVLTAGKSFILGYTNETTDIYPASKDTPVIIFDDFTGAFKWVDFPFKAKSSAMKMLHAKEDVVLLRYVYHWMSVLNFISIDHKRLWIATYSQFPIPLPPLAEQGRIVGILDTFEALCGDLQSGLPREIALRRKQMAYWRERLLDFKEIGA